MKKVIVLSALFTSLIVLQGCASLSSDNCQSPSNSAVTQPLDSQQKALSCHTPESFPLDRV